MLPRTGFANHSPNSTLPSTFDACSQYRRFANRCMVWQLPLSSPEHQTRERELKPTAALTIVTASHLCFLHQTAERVFRLKKHDAIMSRTAETQRAKKAAMELGWIDLPEAKRVSFPVACRHCVTAMLEKGPTKFSGRTRSDKIRNGMVGCTTYGRSASYFRLLLFRFVFV